MATKKLGHGSKSLGSIVRSIRPLKAASRKLASKVNVSTYQRLMLHSILATVFEAIDSLPVFQEREELWDECIYKLTGINAKIVYVEFGVHKGYSIQYFSSRNLNAESVFVGFDSFQGLPEDWVDLKKGTFDTRGAVPETTDSRVSFVRGWFQDTWDELYGRLSLTDADILIVHYDADLYSSTLFALSKIDSLKKRYIAIFDEFTGGEAGALYNYSQAFNASISFIAKTNLDEKYPCQVMCRIAPRSAPVLDTRK